ncbi:hypothetical protein [Rhodococcus triatomae]|nr:hypothetical protein G419_25382 [Rhodococcus triatomae BKS 15-14]
MATLIGSGGDHIEIGPGTPTTTGVLNPPTTGVPGILVPIEGRPGTSITISGSVATYAGLPDDLGLADKGALFIVQADGLGYVWDGTEFPANGEGIEIRGPQGVSITDITVSGDQLILEMSEGVDYVLTVPALTQASTDAAAAAAARTAAETAEANAEAAQTAAETALTQAQTARTDAQAAKAAAETAEDNAAASATSASGSATTATTKAGEASNSATAAAGSATTAGTHAANADSSATAAAGSASSASTSATNASTSATAAAGSADAADEARIAAQAAAAEAESAGGVSTARQINTGTGLTGGGDLSANRTIALDSASIASLAKADAAAPQETVDNLLLTFIDFSDYVSAGFSTVERTDTKGQPDGYVPLDENAKVPALHLPSYVDDVLEFATLGGFPATGETGKIYVATGTGKCYRWSGSTYTEISPSEVNSVAGKTGVVTLVKGDVGLGNVDNTSDLAKPISTATQAALDGKLPRATTAGYKLYAREDLSDVLIDFSSQPNAFQVAQRYDSGRLRVGTAVDSADAVTKAQLDAVPYSVTFTHTGDSVRKTGLGANTAGIDMPDPVTFTRMRVRLTTADASGTTTVRILKNGSATGMPSVSITAPATTGSTTGSWSYAEDDQLTVEITAIGTTPGKGCAVNLKGT